MSRNSKWSMVQIIETTSDYFEEKGIENPRLNAELLLAHTLNLKRVELYLQHARVLKEEEVDAFRQLVKRRASCEPLQYIIGETDFYSIPLKVNPAVLIPRPETEFLVDIILTKICTDEMYPYTIVDVGTGSGAIALALADNLLRAKIYGTDISEEALEVARRNAAENLLDNRVTFLQGNFLEPLKSLNLQGKIELIVSNPPYISEKEWNELPQEVKDFEPRLALYCKEGTSNHMEIVKEGESILCPGGSIVFECGDRQANLIKKKVERDFEIFDVKIFKDYSQKERVVWLRLREETF